MRFLCKNQDAAYKPYFVLLADVCVAAAWDEMVFCFSLTECEENKCDPYHSGQYGSDVPVLHEQIKGNRDDGYVE
jgi:hypothetical protein